MSEMQEGSRKSTTFPSVMNINVGGVKFATRLSTLCRFPESMLAAMFSGRHEVEMDSSNHYFIDRDGTYFHYILNYLRDDIMPPPNCAQEVLTEAMYYGIDELIDVLKSSPSLFAEYIVKDNIRRKLVCYNYVQDELIRLAREEAKEDEAIISYIRLVITKNQPTPGDLQFSKQASKQYYKQFKTYPSFEKCYGKYYIQISTEDVTAHSDEMKNNVASCLANDIAEIGYNCTVKAESCYEDSKIRTVTWCDEEFHMCMSCHLFKFDWLNLDPT